MHVVDEFKEMYVSYMTMVIWIKFNLYLNKKNENTNNPFSKCSFASYWKKFFFVLYNYVGVYVIYQTYSTKFRGRNWVEGRATLTDCTY